MAIVKQRVGPTLNLLYLELCAIRYDSVKPRARAPHVESSTSQRARHEDRT